MSSLSQDREIKVVKILDPRMNIHEKQYFTFVDGGNSIVPRTYPAGSHSNSESTWEVTAPSMMTIVDRRIRYGTTINCLFSGDSGDDNMGLLQTGYDAPRAYPIISILETLKAQINTLERSLSVRKIVKPMLNYNASQDLLLGYTSTTPCMLDQSQDYSQLDNTNRNPLNSYQDSTVGVVEPRGAFPMEIVSNTRYAAEVNFTVELDLYLPPFLYGTQELAEGFIGVQNMTFSFIYSSLLEKLIWSHSDGSPVSSFSLDTVTIGTPTLSFLYITPDQNALREGKKISMMKRQEYPIKDIVAYPNDYASIAPDETVTISTSAVQLKAMPNRVVMFGRRKDIDLDINKADNYLIISNVNIFCDNVDNLLAGATQRDLYRMAKKNGLDQSWPQWSGEDMHMLSGSDDLVVNGNSAPLALEFGTDIALNSGVVPGSKGTYQFAITATLTNKHPTDSFAFTFYFIMIYEGLYTIVDGEASATFSILSEADVARARQMPGLDYNSMLKMSGGKSIFNRLGRKVPAFLRKAIKVGRKVAPVVTELASDLGYEIPYQKQIRALNKASKALGYGLQPLGGAREKKARPARKLPPASSPIGRQFRAWLDGRSASISNYEDYLAYRRARSERTRCGPKKIKAPPKPRKPRAKKSAKPKGPPKKRGRKPKGGIVVGGDLVPRSELERILAEEY